MLSTIKGKTIVTFGVIILISIITTSVLILNTAKVADNTQKFYVEPYSGTNAVWILRRNFLDNQRALYKFLSVTPENREKAGASLQKSLEQNNQELVRTLADLKILAQEKGVDALFESLDDLQKQEAALQKEILQLVFDNDTQRASILMRTAYEPIFNDISEVVLELFKAAQNDAMLFVDNALDSKSSAILFGVILIAVMVAVSGISMVLYLKALIKPLKQVSNVARQMAHGNLSVADQLTYHSNDEIGDLVRHQEEMSKKIAQYINIISNALALLSQKNLQVETQDTFEGEFVEIQNSVQKLVEILNLTLSEINIAASQVGSGASQIASAAQNLSQGTAEQASSIETLSLTIDKILTQVHDNAVNAQKATKETSISGEEITRCSSKMLEMNEAMQQLNQRANEISKINKTIEDISFQTNILALNAAVEAARAGDAGKGFAVVADEVRNLAAKSAEASKSTSSLIEGALKAVEDGGRIAKDTQNALENVVESSHKVTSVVTSIAAASTEQAKAIEEVSSVVQQISSVVQTTSATAEESAAASEELSGQAQALKSLIGTFCLKDSRKINC